MKFTASNIFNAIARGGPKEISWRVYARKTNSLSDSIVGTAGWTEITDRVDMDGFPDIDSKIEYEAGQFTSGRISLTGKDLTWFRDNIFNMTGAGGGTQRLDPDADISNTGPTTWLNEASGDTPLYSSINDGASANDANYIVGSDPEVSECEIRLSDPGSSVPAGDTTVTVRYGCNSDEDFGDELLVELLQGATVKGSMTIGAHLTAFTNESFVVSSGISDFTDLRVRLTTQDGVDKFKIVSWVKVEVPAPGGDYKYLELKVEAKLTGASDIIPVFTGFVDLVGIENDERSNTCRFTAFTADDLGTRIAAENVAAQPLKSNADGAAHDGLILPYVFGMYVMDANISSYVLKVGVHTVTYQYNGGTRRAKLDGGAFVNLSNGNNTLGNVDNGAGDTERVKVYANPVSALPTTDYEEKVIVLVAGDTIPYRYYKDVNARFILSKLYDQIGLTSQTFDTLEQRTYDAAKRVSFIDIPPNNNGVVVATKDAIETDGTDLFVAHNTSIYKRDHLTGVYTLLVSGLAQFPEKLMYNARNNHLWMYGAGSLQRYDITGETLSSEIVLNVTTSNLSHLSVMLYDYNYTGSSWKYGIVYCDRNGGTNQGLFRICDGSSLTVSTIVSGATLGYTGGAGVYQYFMHFMTGGKVRFRAVNNTPQNCYREYSVNGSGVWTDGGEKLAGIEDYRLAAYHAAEGRIYYAFDEGATTYMSIKSHTDASTSITSIYNSSDVSAVSGTAYYAAGDAVVYMSFDEGIGYMLYALASNAKTTVADNLIPQKNQMVYANSRLYFLATASGDYDVNQTGIGLYQWSDQLVLSVPLADFSGSFITDMIRKVLNAFLFMGIISHAKKALVYRRGDIAGTPLTSGHDLSITISDASNIVETVNQYPKADLVVVTNGVTQHSYDGTNFDTTVLGDKRTVTISNSFIPDAIVKDVAYYAYQFFKVDRNLKRFELGMVPLFQYEPFDNLVPSFTTTNIEVTDEGPIYATTCRKDGSLVVEALI